MIEMIPRLHYFSKFFENFVIPYISVTYEEAFGVL